jgi:NDP-sugar pyrophosphorylase family protein
MDAEFMHEFDLIVVPSSVSSIELNATMKFLESVKWVFEARAGIPPTLLICPSRVLNEQLKEDPFSKEKFLMPFMLLPPVLDDPEIRKLYKEKFIFDFDRPSSVAFIKCAESIKQAGEIHKKVNSKVKLKFSDRRILDTNNSKLSRYMSKKTGVFITPQSREKSFKSDLRTSDKKNSSRVSGLMKILTSALAQK